MQNTTVHKMSCVWPQRDLVASLLQQIRFQLPYHCFLGIGHLHVTLSIHNPLLQYNTEMTNAQKANMQQLKKIFVAVKSSESLIQRNAISISAHVAKLIRIQYAVNKLAIISH